MRRVGAKFQLKLHGGKLSGAPAVQKDFLIPPLSEDKFGQRLCNEITYSRKPCIAYHRLIIRYSEPAIAL